MREIKSIIGTKQWALLAWCWHSMIGTLKSIMMLCVCPYNNVLFSVCTEGLMATSDDIVSSTEDYSCSTCSYTGDSGFSDSWAFLKELPSSSSEPVQYPREQGLDTTLNSNVLYASLTATDVHTAAGYYKSLNQESRIPGRHFSQLIGAFITYLHFRCGLLSSECKWSIIQWE